MDSNSQIGNGSYMGAHDFGKHDLGSRDFNSNTQKIKSAAISSRTGKKTANKTAKNQVHVVDDFSSFDAQMLFLDDGSGYAYDQSS